MSKDDVLISGLEITHPHFLIRENGCYQFFKEGLENVGVLPNKFFTPQKILRTNKRMSRYSGRRNGLTGIRPIKIGEGHTQDSFDAWVKKLHNELAVRRKFIDKCTLDDFKNIFTFKNETSRQGKKINWCNRNVFFSAFMQGLSGSGFIAEQFWKQCASCFTIEGEENGAANLKTYPPKATMPQRKIIKEIISTLKNTPERIAAE